MRGQMKEKPMKTEKWSKADAVDYFQGTLVVLRKKEKGRPNYGARLLAWRLFLKDLFLDGCISAKQRDGWRLPQFCRPQLPKQTEAEFLDELNRGYSQDRI